MSPRTTWWKGTKTSWSDCLMERRSRRRSPGAIPPRTWPCCEPKPAACQSPPGPTPMACGWDTWCWPWEGQGRTYGATMGIVGALGEGWRTPAGGSLDRYLQTDTVMYPGFSGGAAGRRRRQSLGAQHLGHPKGRITHCAHPDGAAHRRDNTGSRAGAARLFGSGSPAHPAAREVGAGIEPGNRVAVGLGGAWKPGRKGRHVSGRHNRLPGRPAGPASRRLAGGIGRRADW